MNAVHPTHRNPAVVVALVIVASGCGQVSGSPTTSAAGSTIAAATSTPAPTTMPTTTGVAVLPEFTACVPTNDRIKVGTPETEVISGPSGDVTVEKVLGSTWKGAITATDPRFSGMHYWTASSIKYLLPSSEEGLELGTAAHRIENDEGAWQGWASSASLADGTDATGPAFLAGEGGYEGLTAFIMETDGPCLFNLRGGVAEVPRPPLS